jgi:hypothetical protein
MHKADKEKLTLVLDAAAREEVARWAVEEGRPVSNLLRRIVQAAIERRAAEQQGLAA